MVVVSDGGEGEHQVGGVHSSHSSHTGFSPHLSLMKGVR